MGIREDQHMGFCGGANINARTSDGTTPLGMALQAGQPSRY